MRERLLENWLDRINERGYQPVFCQALASQGHVVVHSTRHGPMEFGKDVVSRDESGHLHAFQLKGNPGSRLTIGQWNEILPQINALMLQPVEPPLCDTAQLAVPYLVTNGEVDEDVHAAIRGLNVIASKQSRPELKLVSRGELIGQYIGPIANLVWPSSTDVDSHILKCWSRDGADFLDPAMLHEVLTIALPFDDMPKSAKLLERTLFGAAIVNEFCLRRYVEVGNHVATLFGRAMFLAAAYAYVHKANVRGFSLDTLRETMWSSMGDDCVDLLAELEQKKNRNYYDGAVHLEFVYHQNVLFLLKAVLASLSLALEKQSKLFLAVRKELESRRKFIREFIAFSLNPGFLIGECVMPQFAFVYWYCCNNSGLNVYDRWPGAILSALLSRNLSEDKARHLLSPYHLMPDILNAQVDAAVGAANPLRRTSSSKRQAWTAMSLFSLVVRRNMKTTARSLFPEMTKYVHRSLAFGDEWSYGLYRAAGAKELGEQLEFPAKWEDVISRTKAQPKLPIPTGLSEDLFTLALFLLVCPFRFSEPVCNFLDEMLVGTWHK